MGSLYLKGLDFENRHTILYIYIYIYILFNPINPELGTIPSRTNRIFKNRILNLSNPNQEFNVNKIHRAYIYIYIYYFNLLQEIYSLLRITFFHKVFSDIKLFDQSHWIL